MKTQAWIVPKVPSWLRVWLVEEYPGVPMVAVTDAIVKTSGARHGPNANHLLFIKSQMPLC